MTNKKAFLIVVRFFLFLEERNIFDNYFIYFSNWNPHRGKYESFSEFFMNVSTDSTLPESFINAVPWNETDEGVNFWLTINRDWIEELDLIN